MAREIGIILVLIFIVISLTLMADFVKKNAEIGDAGKFVLEDLRTTYPGCDIELITVNEKMNKDGERYYEVKAKVTLKQGSPCPERFHIYYNYPEQNFIPQSPEYITKDCIVCKEGPCVLAFPEEAIIASHTLNNTEEVRNFILLYDDATAVAEELPTKWLVRWSANSSDFGIEVELTKDGKVLSKTFTD